MGRPPPGVQAGSAACQVSSETRARQKRSKLFADIFEQAAPVTIAALEDGSIIPAATAPGLRALKPVPIFIPSRALIRAAGFVQGVRRYCPASRAGRATGITFAFGAGWSFARPYDAFWALASILGLLLIFQGTFYIITSVSTREVNSTWWLGLAVGILEILLGFWASQQYRPVQGALLLIWVGFFALFRGISEIVIAFELRRAQHR